MKRLARALLATAILAVPAQQAAAQTSISHVAQFSPASTVLYLPFNVLGAGTFTLETFGGGNWNLPSPIDPVLMLFSGVSFDGAGLGAFRTFNDDGAFPDLNSVITENLGVGGYTLAMSTWTFSLGEATSGVNPFSNSSTLCDDDANWADCVYTVNITSDQGVATALSTATVPEPVTILLLGTGLLGIAAVRRRRDTEE